jgi:hypothetical protein
VGGPQWPKKDSKLLNQIISKCLTKISYLSGSNKYYGKAIGVERKATKEATKKELKELSRMQTTAQPIEIQYNPKDPSQSFFFFDKNSIYFAVFLMIFPISLGLIIVFIIFSKIKIRSS